MDNLITKYLAGQATPEEQDSLAVWRKVSSENELHFQQMATAWEAAAFQETMFPPSPDLALDKVHLKLQATKQQKVRQLRLWAVSAAAVISLFIGLGYLLTLPKAAVWQTYQMAANETGEITLPDGSIVSLREGSQLRFPDKFSSKKREVILSGEAFFEVAKDSTKPFRILTDKVVTSVLGTSFQLTARDSIVQIAIVTGKVAFYPTADSLQPLILTPGQRGTYHSLRDSLAQTPYDNPNLLAWKTHQLVFDNRSMEAVARELSDYFGKEVLIASDELKAKRLTSKYDHPELAEVLAELTTILGVETKVDGDRISLYLPN